ncbi:MAG: PLP-dependent aspartate aminotransferase family protein [Polyangiaceae bacterium]|nr:PLP-dependent aspartate aminotransferase family protein [Polyangiaceae bacterium]
MPIDRDSWDLETLAVHADCREPFLGAVTEPIVLSTTFGQPEPGRPIRFEYGRSGNPTREALEQALASLEGANFGLAFASGSAATLNVLATLQPEAHVICGDDVYGGTFRLLEHARKTQRLEITRLDLRDIRAFENAFRPSTRLVWFETPTNPTLKVFDITLLSAVAAKYGVRVVVDNTFATPILQRPLSLGATAVVHSTTKYINGHSDVVGGAVLTNDSTLYEQLKWTQNALGAVPSPFDCYLTLRGIKTLPLRIRRSCETAAQLGTQLAAHPSVEHVFYPGLPDHPDHELAARQMNMPGAMISLQLRGGLEPARNFLMKLRLFTLAESLGAVESLAEHPASMTHASIPKAERDRLGISDGLVRLSVGIEAPKDLWADLEQALA